MDEQEKDHMHGSRDDAFAPRSHAEREDALGRLLELKPTERHLEIDGLCERKVPIGPRIDRLWVRLAGQLSRGRKRLRSAERDLPRVGDPPRISGRAGGGWGAPQTP